MPIIWIPQYVTGPGMTGPGITDHRTNIRFQDIGMTGPGITDHRTNIRFQDIVFSPYIMQKSESQHSVCCCRVKHIQVRVPEKIFVFVTEMDISAKGEFAMFSVYSFCSRNDVIS